MGKRVHARCGCQRRRHAHHQQGVVDGHAWGAAPVHNGHLYLAGRIGDDAETGHFRSRARCGVDRYIWGEGFCGFVHAFVIVDFSAIAGQEAHALAAVVGTAPAKGNQAVALFVPIYAKGLFNIFISGIGHGFVVNGIDHAAGIENICYLLENADSHNALVRYHKRLFAADDSQAIRNLRRAMLANQGYSRNKERRNLAKVHAFDIRTHSGPPLQIEKQ